MTRNTEDNGTLMPDSNSNGHNESGAVCPAGDGREGAVRAVDGGAGCEETASMDGDDAVQGDEVAATRESRHASVSGLAADGVRQDPPVFREEEAARASAPVAQSQKGASYQGLARSVWEQIKVFADSAVIRWGLIGFITVLLLTPLDWVDGIVREREERHDEAAREISERWGGAQVVSGPVLVVPYEVWTSYMEKVTVKVKNRDVQEEVERREYHTRYKVFLPEDLHVDVRLDPELRYRGIFKKALYDAPVKIDGTFAFPKEEEFASNLHKVHWDKAWLAVGITDRKAFAGGKPLVWEGEAVSGFKSETKTSGILENGFHCAVALADDTAGTTRRFELQFNVRGSNGISFTPVGERTKITAHGAWAGPSFQGDLLPSSRIVEEDGFSAEWIISSLTRAYPQTAELGSTDFFRMHGNSKTSLVESFTAGVDLHENLSLYRLVFRAVKYAVLFIAVTFVALFAVEMFSGCRMQLMQYGMVGLSMSVFYLLLLSLAEHISFESAFAAASAVTVGMNGVYLAAVLGSLVRGLGMGVLLAGLYGLLFALLRMEDTALLVGTGLVVAMMGVLMFVTRKPARKAGGGEERALG